MRKEASLEEWKKLYDIAIKTKELEPWEYLWDMDVITLFIPEREPILCSVMGGGGTFYGIGAFIGEDAIGNFYKVSEKDDIPPGQMMRYQEDNIIMCNFGSRDELSSKEWKLVKELGYKFRGKNNWIYFHSYKRGYMPYILDQEEVLLATEIYQNLYMALRSYIFEDLSVDFEGGHTLVRVYSPEKELWLNFQAPRVIPEVNYLIPVLKDENLVNKIGEMKKISDIWEMDISFLNMSIEDKEYGRPINAKSCLLADRKSGIIIKQNMLTPTDDYLQAVMNILIPVLMDYGRPEKILVRDEYLYYMLEDLCKRANINLEIKGRLKAIDSFIEEISSFA